TPISLDPSKWRIFEVTTRAEIIGSRGAVVRVWLPLPLTPGTDYQRSLSLNWSGNAPIVRTLRDDRYGAGLLYAEWAPGEPGPVVEAVCRVATRDRAVDPSGSTAGAAEDRQSLKVFLHPTHLLPTGGIVRHTAEEITQGQRTDVERARALYE